MPRSRIRLGFWPPVYGNWLLSDRREDSDASFDTTRRLTLLAERFGADIAPLLRG